MSRDVQGTSSSSNEKVGRIIFTDCYRARRGYLTNEEYRRFRKGSVEENNLWSGGQRIGPLGDTVDSMSGNRGDPGLIAEKK